MTRIAVVTPSPNLPLARPRARPELDDEEDDAIVDTANRALWTGLIVIVLFFGFLGTWAALSQLDSAVSAMGVVEVKGSRQVVEHADGGVVKEILVKEGQLVKRGQELLHLEQTQVKAGLDMQTSQVDTLLAMATRLEAERDGAGTIAFPRALQDRAGEAGVADILATQRSLFAARQSELQGQVGILTQQAAQARSQLSGLESQLSALTAQEALVKDELSSMQQLFENGFATKTRLLALQRAAAALGGQRGEVASNLARMRIAANQLDQQVAQARRQRMAEVSRELEDVRARLADARERQTATRDVLQRTIIRAPADGHVLGLAINTIGSVVERGETLFEILPEGGATMIEVRLGPSDGQVAREGMRAEVRFLSTKSRRLKPVWGRITRRSVDLLADARTGERYYTVQVTIDPAEQAKLPPGTLDPGAPVEVVIATGSRSALQYLLDPIRTTFDHGLREP